MANWFSDKRRGIAVGGFCTCVNIFNILGVQIGSALLRAFDDKWQWLFVIQAAFVLILALVLWLLLVPDPQEMGFIVADEVLKEKVGEELRNMISKTKENDQ